MIETGCVEKFEIVLKVIGDLAEAIVLRRHDFIKSIVRRVYYGLFLVIALR